MTALLLEYYDPEDTPGDALGRAARVVMRSGALYVGAGVGVEKTGGDGSGREVAYVVTSGGRTERFVGPLSATTRGFELAGRATTEDSPGGSTPLTSPTAAARARELRGSIARLERDVQRYRAAVAREARKGLVPGVGRDEAWEVGALQRSQDELRQARTELRTLMRTGKAEEALAEEVGKPGTNWKQVSPAARRKIHPIVAHYRKRAHPFTECVADNTKRFGPERAKRVCAVVKDLGQRSTRWRKGGGRVKEGELLAAARERIAIVEEALGPVGVMRVVEGDYEGDTLDTLAEGLFADMTALYLLGEGPAPVVVAEAFGAGAPAAGARSTVKKRRLARSAPASRARGSGTFDESKHKRGARGSRDGGKFVSKGASGWAAKKVQTRLGITTDGRYGDKTKQAVMDFQKRHGLQVDGVVGRQTALAMAGRFARARRGTPGSLRASDMRLLRGLRAPSFKRVRAGGGWTV